MIIACPFWNQGWRVRLILSLISASCSRTASCRGNESYWMHNFECASCCVHPPASGNRLPMQPVRTTASPSLHTLALKYARFLFPSLSSCQYQPKGRTPRARRWCLTLPWALNCNAYSYVRFLKESIADTYAGLCVVIFLTGTLRRAPA